MNIIGTIYIESDEGIIEDIQLWTETNLDASTVKEKVQAKRFKQLCYMDYRVVPIYLVNCRPFYVYSAEEKTCEFFRRRLVSVTRYKEEAGILMKCSDNDNYIVMYVEKKGERPEIRCLLLSSADFDEKRPLRDVQTRSVIDIPLSSLKSDISIFDKVLSDKKRQTKRNQFIFNQGLESRADMSRLSLHKLHSNEEVMEAVNRIIMSGLRIRGLNLKKQDYCSKEKIRVREIYQMTYKSTLFALRKYNKKKVAGSDSSDSIRLDDVQDIVEKLLQVYVDVDI